MSHPQRSRRWLLALLLPLALLFASTGLDSPRQAEKAPATQEAVERNVAGLQASSAVTVAAPTTTSTTQVVTTTTAAPAPPTTARPRPTPTTTAAPPVTEASPVTEAPAPEPESEPLPTGSGNGDPNDDASWERLAQCESGGNWSINTGNGYYGGLQFSLSSWRAVGGTGYPHEASRATQIEMGRRLHAQGGWGHWPGCTRSFGWR